MLVFPNCKINLGLHVVNKRTDGFHNIETVFYPVSWCDGLEVLENKESQEGFIFTESGIPIAGDPSQNLIYKAWEIIKTEKKLPALKVHLHKNIPMGAGLGGGSSDAAYFINLLNDQCDLNYTEEEKTGIASQLGSDCAFFIKNTPLFAKGKGNEFSEIKVDLSEYFIFLVYPNVHSNTKEAYDGLIPKHPDNDLGTILASPLKEWKEKLVNDFEGSIFKKYPEVKVLKESMYAAGALYASMSGSGSAVFGIFEKEPIIHFPEHFSTYLQKPLKKIL
ncbi:4-(cytidine 5'-diphospho)-2-C-methyl-D-erythritol kinase [Sphingobacteriaceae bacterium]|nr:4-(cytidine 5'-diphospho)-2-C-methyl-D-erythritol kinase [Sphingobacteriaceae bacterium]